MVVLGAGASFDSVASYRYREGYPDLFRDDRPPLADALFENRDAFVRALSEFTECHAIIDRLRDREGGSVEQVLEAMQQDAQRYNRRYRQLAAVRWYLQTI